MFQVFQSVSSSKIEIFILLNIIIVIRNNKQNPKDLHKKGILTFKNINKVLSFPEIIINVRISISISDMAIHFPST